MFAQSLAVPTVRQTAVHQNATEQGFGEASTHLHGFNAGNESCPMEGLADSSHVSFRLSTQPDVTGAFISPMNPGWPLAREAIDAVSYTRSAGF